MNLKHLWICRICAIIVLAILAACGNVTTPLPQNPAPALPLAPENPATNYHFVTNRLVVPTTHAESRSLALNLDADPANKPDNLIGDMLATLLSIAPNLRPQPELDQMISDGQLVELHMLTAHNLQNDPAAQWQLFRGVEPESKPKFDGSDVFTLDPLHANNALIGGSITNGHFSGGPSTAHIEMAFMGVPLEVDLIGVHIESDVTTNGCTNAILGGGLTEKDFRTVFLPALADGLNKAIMADPHSSWTTTLLAAFDADGNRGIARAELEGNVLLRAATSPDLDLLDAAGQANPGQDGVKDSLSIGFGFSCVPAGFTAPGE